MIDVSSAVRVSIRALGTNKMRSALTMLGIIIGVGAVIAMLALGTGAKNKIGAQIASMGSNLLIVLPGASTSGGARMGAGSTTTLSMGDSDAILRESPSVAEVAPMLTGIAQIVYRQLNWSTTVVGTTPSMMTVRDWQLEKGRFFTDQDVKRSNKVCVLGKTVVDNIFGNTDPVGRIIRIKNVPFTVVGLLDSKGQSVMGQDQDDIIYVPVTVAQKKLFGTSFPGMVRLIMVKARSADDMSGAEAQLSALLKQRHRIGPKQESDFTIRNLTQLMKTAEQSAKVMTILLGAIASISLLVGGIGIMNIMLVSVTERTREIGIRMAVGARAIDIRVQFMIEAVMLSLIGGIAGIALGISGSKLLSVFAGWPTEVSVLSLFLAFGFSGFVGIFFGFYPAYKASLLNPIDALRYE